MFVNVDLIEWPDEATAAKGEAEVRNYGAPSENMDLELIDWPLVVSGPVADDPTGRLQHGAITRHKDFSEWDNVPELFASVLSDDPEDLGPTVIYHYWSWFGFRIVDFDDPYLVEHGAEGWSRRLSEPYLEACRKYPNYGRVMNTLAFRNGWGRGSHPPRIAEAWVRDQAGLPFFE